MTNERPLPGADAATAPDGTPALPSDSVGDDYALPDDFMGSQEYWDQFDIPVHYNDDPDEFDWDASDESTADQPGTDEPAPDAPTSISIEGDVDGRMVIESPLTVVFTDPSPRVDTANMPVSQIAGEIRTSSGVVQPVTLFLTGWNPEHPDAPATYNSRPLTATAGEHSDQLPLQDGDSISVMVGGRADRVDHVYADEFDFLRWRQQRELKLSGIFLAELLRSYRSATAGVDDPTVQVNVQILTEGLRTAQQGLDHFNDPASTQAAQLGRGQYYLDHLPTRPASIQRLLDGLSMQSPFALDPRNSRSLKRHWRTKRELDTGLTIRETFGNLVVDAEMWGRFKAGEKFADAVAGLTKDLLFGSYDWLVGETPWGWLYPIANLLVEGELRNHHNQALTPGDAALLGLTIGLKAVDKTHSTLELTSRFTKAGEDRVHDVTAALESKASEWMADKGTDLFVGKIVEPILSDTVGKYANLAGLDTPAGTAEAPPPQAPPPPSPAPEAPASDGETDIDELFGPPPAHLQELDAIPDGTPPDEDWGSPEPDAAGSFFSGRWLIAGAVAVIVIGALLGASLLGGGDDGAEEVPALGAGDATANTGGAGTEGGEPTSAAPAVADDAVPVDLLGDFVWYGDGVINFSVEGDRIVGRVTTPGTHSVVNFLVGIGVICPEFVSDVVFDLDLTGHGQWFWYKNLPCERLGGAEVTVNFLVTGADARGQQPANHPGFNGNPQGHTMLRVSN